MQTFSYHIHNGHYKGQAGILVREFCFPHTRVQVVCPAQAYRTLTTAYAFPALKSPGLPHSAQTPEPTHSSSLSPRPTCPSLLPNPAAAFTKQTSSKQSLPLFHPFSNTKTNVKNGFWWFSTLTVYCLGWFFNKFRCLGPTRRHFKQYL